MHPAISTWGKRIWRSRESQRWVDLDECHLQNFSLCDFLKIFSIEDFLYLTFNEVYPGINVISGSGL